MGLSQKKQKNLQYEANNMVADQEFVTANVLALLFGVAPITIRGNDLVGIEHIRFIENGRGRKFHFNDAARLMCPGLSDLECSLLRIDIQDRLARKERKNAILENERERKRE